MIIGIPKEIKPQEHRVAITPSGVESFVSAGHKVLIEAGAGEGSGFSDKEYAAAGAKMVKGAAKVYAAAEMVMKVKEPLKAEYGLLREGQILFTYLHLAPDEAQVKALVKAKVIGIAYETVQLPNGALPLLAPMSEVAGRMAVQVGAYLLQKANGGRGVLLGGVPGVERGHVVIIGGGNVGINAAKMATGLDARVTLLDISQERLAFIDGMFGSKVVTLMSNSYNIAKSVADADVVIGAVLVPGARAPKLVTEKMVKAMRPGSVLIDVAIDQGGSIETIDRLTSHLDPYFVEHGVTHYSVPNMPGAVPRTSTFALTNATMPYALQLANKGAEAAMRDNPALLKGLNVYKGKVTFKAVAEAQNLKWEPVTF
ncbi:MAG: alanine dehydrogenase [Kiritimatiellaeota bacterium]|nr:alanine dehydrogenase [Kiritimatiellota bacterium]